jgi:hypothetical protein
MLLSMTFHSMITMEMAKLIIFVLSGPDLTGAGVQSGGAGATIPEACLKMIPLP